MGNSPSIRVNHTRRRAEESFQKEIAADTFSCTTGREFTVICIDYLTQNANRQPSSFYSTTCMRSVESICMPMDLFTEPLKSEHRQRHILMLEYITTLNLPNLH